MKKITCFMLIVVLAMSMFAIVACQQHTCQNVCPTCGKCTNNACTESICADKCLGHAPAHTCQSKCPTCGKCLNEDCAESVCADKCQGHAPAHTCQNKCDQCGKCTNATCTETVCQNKCTGHSQGSTEKVTVYMVGDSTVCNYTNDTSLAFPRNGYGMWVGNYLNENATVVNLALSGRSSKSFLQESNYTTLKNSISAGDYLIIGFGHNDEKVEDDTRYTNPTGDVNDQTSFQYYLYTYYVKLAMDAGAHPILCTPIVRRNTNNNYTSGDGHIKNGGDYAQAIVDLGAQYNVPVIHLRDLTKAYYSSLTADQTAKLHATTGKVETNIDNTHLNSYGAAQVAYMFAKALSTSTSGLASYVDTSKLVAPVYEDVIIKNEFDQPEPGDTTVYGKWEVTSYGSYDIAKHQGLDLTYYSTVGIGVLYDGSVSYIRPNDGGNGKVGKSDGVINTEYCYLEFVPTADGIIEIPIKNATGKALHINCINKETDRIVTAGGFMAGLENQTGDFFTVTIGSTRFVLTLTVKQGNTYRIALAGSKMGVFDCTWQETSGSTDNDQDQPDEPQMDLTETNTVVVMLDGDYTNADLSKLQLKAYNSDFYGLNYNLDRTLTIESYTAELVDGKTKVTFTVKESVFGIFVADHFSTPNYDSAKKESIIKQATYAVSWQLDNGGWDKDYSLHISRAWNGTESKKTEGWDVNGTILGTIDNNGTYSEMRLIAEAYRLSTDETQKKLFLDSFNKAFAFLQDLQYPTGGFAQVYPRRDNYSDNVTFNDDAMVNVLRLLQDISKQKYPFDQGGIADSATQQLSATMMQKGVQYILDSQIVVNGTKTAWCAQHHPQTYAPVKARAYEHPSISGSESVGIIKFLLTLVDNAKAQSAAKAAIAYLDSVKLSNTAYDDEVAPYLIEEQGAATWYRFYEIGTNKGIFSNKSTGAIYYDITKLTDSDRTSYSWCVDTPKKLIKVYSEVGYYANKVVVVASADIAGNGCTLQKDSVVNIQVPMK
ncbi:MAG: pectate lyase [Clostridia bacterium]|nr:pectate lyase [Clostridia bacterium]MBQ3041932.1 pectate lyase [Clostridia bacterium]